MTISGWSSGQASGEAWDTRVELAKSVIRWVRKDRKEAQVEWTAKMAKYHADKARKNEIKVSNHF